MMRARDGRLFCVSDKKLRRLRRHVKKEAPAGNTGYTIRDRTRIGTSEIVFAENQQAARPYVTWLISECGGFRDDCAGHYFSDKPAALADYLARIRREEKLCRR